MRTIYLAGASSEAELVGSYMRKIEDFGEEVAYDWTRLVLANLANGIKDTDLTNRQRRCIADDCVDSIREADQFWLLIPEDPKSSIGCWVELGLAIELDKHVTVSGDLSASPFLEHASEMFTTHDRALAGFGRWRC